MVTMFYNIIFLEVNMRKLLAFALVIMMVAMLATGISAANVNFNAAKGTAVIDCVKDDVYLAADEVVVAFGATADTASGKVWAVWDDKALYFFAEIADKTLSSAKHATDSVWERDSCEFYVDFTNARKTQISQPSTQRSIPQVFHTATENYGAVWAVTGLLSPRPVHL